ncbi:hypothetical protein [Amycolatopsis sp. YIM 10]|uniref:hypothetical protein n=1 Tax=Amycolatopsis sp. YIM 10 TaxID=2653857 RepID=UPI00129084F1|nr:hypothetical protein [Amycolatopsis sp. YIM 10]QFU85486.1 hypothetical protein YIM_01265 [Amycolatopsis sp. YIM 10]
MTTPSSAPKSPQELQEMSPSQRDAYLQQQAANGVPQDSWLLGPILEMQARMKAQEQADKMGENNVKTLTSGSDVQYVEGLKPSDADYLGHDHAQISGYVNNNLKPEQIVEVSDAYHQLHKDFKDFATSLGDAVNKSMGAWEGEGASSARKYFSSLATWSDGNSENAKLASEVMFQQADAATRAKNKMPEEIPFDWNTEMEKWGGNPLDLMSNINESIDTYHKSQQAHTEAAGVMADYDKELYEAASKQPVFAEPPKFDTGGGGSVTPPGGNGNDGTSGSGFNGGSAGNIPGGGSGAGGGSGSGGIGSGSVGTPPPMQDGSKIGAGSLPSNTNPAGYQPPNFSNPGGQNLNTTNPSPYAPMPMGGMNQFGPGGGAGDYNSKIGRGGGGGAGTPGFGPGGGGSSSGAGMAKPGGVGAAEAAGRGMGGPGGAGAGRAGGMGAGGMGGAGGRGGQGEEDQEHTRPAYLLEGDPDEIFGTDQRTAPPVIGE